ncbi:MAG: DEAD/DEAH box helicase family protein [Snowella sp.]|nr:DEAD/DEAH box helicase family protein [Snowella sp.]
MPSNFDFLQTDFPELFEHATHAEKLVQNPRACCFYSRYTLEQSVIWLYANDPYLQLPDDKSLGSLLHEKTFRDNLSPGLFQKLRAIQRLGNIAAHQSTAIPAKDSIYILEELFHFLYWLCRYYSPNGKKLKNIAFNAELLTLQTTPKKPDLTLQQLETLEQKLDQAQTLRQLAETQKQQTEAELAAAKAQLDQLLKANKAVPDDHDLNERQTRERWIDILLKEAGWNIHQPDWTEYQVEGMPESTNPSGIGHVDYVLWADDGKPLAVIEAKRTRKDAKLGERQAELYANCLEQKFGQRPIIFYSNGFEHWIWDDLNYPPRPIQGFLKKDELERLIFRRSQRKSLDLVEINDKIINRSYQEEAIRRITETFQPILTHTPKGRKALLVMATGTGKTRTAIALVDLLNKANWVKRILFLADRNPLLRQAKGAFKAHAPNLSVVTLGEVSNAEAATANVVLSTYPTMFNRIEISDGDRQLFGVGHFDLVIVDEAHRSIYQKYRALFTYFDSLLVGLTATPRNEIERDTYQIFDLEKGIPTYAYELDSAIADGYLVPPKAINVSFKFIRRGIKYDDLSEEEKTEYEEKFRDEETDEIPDQINAAAINRWLFNIPTIDQALELLMQQGLKVEGGDRLGKTIIFARNHKHAEKIIERFDANYGHYNGKFARIIDSHDPYAQSILDNFYDPKNYPQIAVSVDMLDTGVDVPEVVNLVFFKPVYSRVKFNQMVGRGTRLCPDLFGIGEDKTEFLIFDLCGNCDYFNQNIPETETKLRPSLTSRLIQQRLNLSQLLTTPEHQELRDSVLDHLHQHVATMEETNFLVRPHLPTVQEFSNRDRWKNLKTDDLQFISQTLSTLPNGLSDGDRLAKEFDLLCLKLQISILKNSPNFEQLRDQVREILSRLEAEKHTVPMVKAQLPLIAEVQTEDWWQDVTLAMIETVRRNLRDLIKFLDPKEQKLAITNFADELEDISETTVRIATTGFNREQYRKKVTAYIQAHQDHLAIAKLKRNLPLTENDLDALQEMLFTAEEVESRDRFEEVFGKNLNLKVFIRQLVGLDRNAAKEAFNKYLTGNNFTANQIRFVEEIIDYLTQRGIMNPGLLYEPPFTNIHDEGLDGLFSTDDADQIWNLVRSFNETVGATFGQQTA